jgi:hypothetical protein
MQVMLNPGNRVMSYKVDDDLTLHRGRWVKVTKRQGEALLGSQYNGKPLVVAEDAESGYDEAEETPESESVE